MLHDEQLQTHVHRIIVKGCALMSKFLALAQSLKSFMHFFVSVLVSLGTKLRCSSSNSSSTMVKSNRLVDSRLLPSLRDRLEDLGILRRLTARYQLQVYNPQPACSTITTHAFQGAYFCKSLTTHIAKIASNPGIQCKNDIEYKFVQVTLETAAQRLIRHAAADSE